MRGWPRGRAVCRGAGGASCGVREMNWCGSRWEVSARKGAEGENRREIRRDSFAVIAIYVGRNPTFSQETRRRRERLSGGAI